MADTSRAWRPVPNFEGLYEASDLGDIRSLDHEVRSRGGTRMVRGRVLRPRRRKDGYMQVALSKDGVLSYFLVHAVVAATFHGPRPASQEVRHGDGNKANNTAQNLSYSDHDENQRDQLRHGTHHFANKTRCKHGHEWSEANTYRAPGSGHRLCRTCRSQHRANARAKAVAA